MPKLTESFVQSRKPDGRDRLFTDSQLPGFGLASPPPLPNSFWSKPVSPAVAAK